MRKKLSLKVFVTAGLLSFAACSETTPKAYLKPFRAEEKIQSNVQGYNPSVDILFVVDDSASMDVHQDRMAKNIAKFTNVFLSSSNLDYNIGVTTTTMDVSDPFGRRYPYCCGKLVGRNVKVITSKLPSANQYIAQNLQVGGEGAGYEKHFDAAFSALSEPNLSTNNQGFLRPQATLVVIFLTDAEDQSDNVSGAQLYDHLVSLKGGDRNKVLAYAAFIPTNDTYNCKRDTGAMGETGPPPTRIEGFLNMFPNSKTNSMNLCDPDFGTKLANLAQDIVNNSGRVILLDRAPQAGTIVITYGSKTIPQDYDKGWLYDPARNAIILGDHIDWSGEPNGTTIQVHYDAYNYDQ